MSRQAALRAAGGGREKNKQEPVHLRSIVHPVPDGSVPEGDGTQMRRRERENASRSGGKSTWVNQSANTQITVTQVRAYTRAGISPEIHVLLLRKSQDEREEHMFPPLTLVFRATVTGDRAGRTEKWHEVQGS